MNKLLVIFIAIFSISSSCEKPPGATYRYRIWIENKSEIGISYQINELYPDTLIQSNIDVLMLVPGDKHVHDKIEKWEVFFSQLPADTLSVFFYSTDTLSKYSFEEVQESYMILERYDFSLQDLESWNWTVSYPLEK